MRDDSRNSGRAPSGKRKGKKELKIYSNGQEIDFLKISTNNVGIEAQVKWTTEAVSRSNTKEKQLTTILTTKDVHSKVKTDSARSELLPK